MLWKSFLFFSKKAFVTHATKLSYISGKAYSGPEAYSEHCQTSTMERFTKIAQEITKVLIFYYISGNETF